MQIAILSGKGGTGKTLLSVNLSYLAKDSIYVDCDIEEPNGLLYYKTDNVREEVIYTTVPVIDHSICTRCGKCTVFCEFNALANILDKVRVFKELCHACGGCQLVCPVGAITEEAKELGLIKSTQYEDTLVISGEMRIGEESGVPIIKQLLKRVRNQKEITFIDAPPGNGCSVMESISEADYCLLVAEPSIFGLHNLTMVYRLAKKFNKKIGLVINKSTEDNLIRDFAKKEAIQIIGEIPMNLDLGNANSKGEIVAKEERFRGYFEPILTKVLEEVSQ